MIWNNVVEKKMYVQGGVGAVGDGERFGNNYDLPNATAYNETCAAIANVFWDQRMFQLHGDAKYVDILERSLYNGLLSGVGMDGNSFFYTNAMEIKNHFSHPDKEAERSGWFPCSCCPTNVARLIPSIPGYVYGKTNSDLYVNLFISSTTSVNVNNKDIQVIQENNYPWDGNLTFRFNPMLPVAFNLKLRVPGWASNQAMPSDLYSFETSSDKKVTLKINGKPTEFAVDKGYATVSRTWKKGDVVELFLPMEVRKVIANQNVKEDIGKVALQRGPLMYCAEWPDNGGKSSNPILSGTATISTVFQPALVHRL